MNEESLSTKQMLLNIIWMRSRASSLADQNKRYSAFLKFILEQDFINEEVPLPPLKELSEAAGIKYSQLRKLIEEVYLNLIHYETQPSFSFSKIRYEFYIRGWRKKSVYAKVDKLPIIPRVGEFVNMPFFSALLGTSQFYVDEIRHEFEDDTQVVNFLLKQGTYNTY